MVENEDNIALCRPGQIWNVTGTILIERNPYFREGLRALLTEAGHEIVASFKTLAAAAAMPVVGLPDLAIVGPGNNSMGAEELSTLRQLLPASHRLRSVLLLDFRDADAIWQSAHAGFDAVLSKDVSGDVLVRSLELVTMGQQIFPPIGRSLPTVTAGSDPRPARSAVCNDDLADGVSLSEREKETLRRLISGASNKTLAQQLLVSEATIKARIRSLLRKLGQTNRIQLALWAVNHPAVWRRSDAERSSSLPDRQLDPLKVPDRASIRVKATVTA